MALPSPPIRNMTDFVVFAFVSIVAFTLIAAVVGVMGVAMFTDRDVSDAISVLTEVITSLISALIGFLAGKGQGRAEVDEEHLRQQQGQAPT